jgi:hypothetical protein
MRSTTLGDAFVSVSHARLMNIRTAKMMIAATIKISITLVMLIQSSQVARWELDAPPLIRGR